MKFFIKAISIFLIVSFLWQNQSHSTYEVENGCLPVQQAGLRPIAVGEGRRMTSGLFKGVAPLTAIIRDYHSDWAKHRSDVLTAVGELRNMSYRDILKEWSLKEKWPQYYAGEEEKDLSDEISALSDEEFRQRFEKAYRSGEFDIERGDDTSFEGFMNEVVFEEGPRHEAFAKNFFGVIAKEAQTRSLNPQELEWKILTRDLIRRWHAVSQFTQEDIAEIMANLRQISEAMTAGNQVQVFSIDHWRRYAYILKDSPKYITDVKGKELPWTFRELLIDLKLVEIRMSPNITLREIGRFHLEQLIRNLRALRRLYEKLGHDFDSDQSVKLLLDGRVIIEPRLIKRGFGYPYYWDPDSFMIRMVKPEESSDKDPSLVPVTWEQITDRDFRLPKPPTRSAPRYDFLGFVTKVEGFIATRDAQGILELLRTEFSEPDDSEHDAQGRALLENVRAILNAPEFGYARGTMRDIVKGGEKERRAVYVLKRLYEIGRFFSGALKHQQLTAYGQVYSELIRMLGRETILDNPELLSLIPDHIVAAQLRSEPAQPQPFPTPKQDLAAI